MKFTYWFASIFLCAAMFAYIQVTQQDPAMAFLFWLFAMFCIFAMLYDAKELGGKSHYWALSYVYSFDGAVNSSYFGRMIAPAVSDEKSPSFLINAEKYILKDLQEKNADLKNIRVAMINMDYLGFYRLDNKQPKESSLS
ncbi:hypothetical protein [Acinetobacter brisouii]|uniref:hypothetical protein n=1 Tax=Acinetobacter brisouii TaxID=396323 RepID=UPI00124C3276|nr:hypothetical protein [Acinetobacter brisouii]